MWFTPSAKGLPPAVKQKSVEKADRTNRLLPLVSNSYSDALSIVSDAHVFSSHLQTNAKISYELQPDRGAYLYILEDGPVLVNGRTLPALATARIENEPEFDIKGGGGRDAEILLMDVRI